MQSHSQIRNFLDLLGSEHARFCGIFEGLWRNLKQIPRKNAIEGINRTRRRLLLGLRRIALGALVNRKEFVDSERDRKLRI